MTWNSDMLRIMADADMIAIFATVWASRDEYLSTESRLNRMQTRMAWMFCAVSLARVVSEETT